MIINVGTTNDAKVDAVKDTIQDYDILKDAKVNPIGVASDVEDQPKSIEETIKGAKNRARNAFKSCKYSIGLESGLMKVPETKTGYMDVCVCAIYDGKDFHLGFSSAFEYPKEAVRLVFEEGLDITQAFNRLKLTDNPKLGSAGGAIGILTKGRITRKELTKQAIINALIHLENPKLF